MNTEELRQASNLLLEQYWILQEEQPKDFELVRTHESLLRTWFRERLGYDLIVHRKIFARLEKIPARGSDNMALDPDVFKTPMDYTVLFALLSFLESRYDLTFLISEFLEELRIIIGEEDHLFLEKHRNRLSIIRVFKYAIKTGILINRDGDIDTFEKEVLFKVPSVARYFLRPFPCEVQEGLENPSLWAHLPEEDIKQRVYRLLLLEPALLFSEMAPEEVQYVKRNASFIAKDILEYTPFRFELYAEGAMLIRSDPEGSMARDYPSDSSLSDVALHLAERLKEYYLDHSLHPDHAGLVMMSTLEWRRHLLNLKKEYGTYWKKEYAVDLTDNKLVEEITKYLESWNMVQRPDAHSVRLSPTIVRVTGKIVDKGEPKNELETD
ncbi:TIGR02678 family protein [Paenibacillus allorhizosphaerae]|uniref:TIGR02678 family protein n=1 Tax=Paenibacillus allorhizosphaerae TaxID=2849866 RepID=A0ABM8VNL8_9BACL|nr:TIGR02678 family protein [Paenibacillus allorhizosphaerae]CAG7651667.1 hypothetical protein PAECIP111802_05021 [Paenibacillus allorhizosphaerae]